MASTDTKHVLYHHPYSSCSIMARLSFAYRGKAMNGQDDVELKEEVVDLMNKGQLTEHYLCDVNGYGEVPVLVFPDGKPMPDSEKITHYLARIYPSLIPAEHAGEIERLLTELHSINLFSLTFTGHRDYSHGNIKFLQQRLEENISDRYREAISKKIARVQELQLGGLEEDEVERNVQRARAFGKELEAALEDSQTGWFLGLGQPSALDAHALVFIERMRDVDRGELIPDTVKAYADKAMAKDGWKSVMQGRRTKPPIL